MAGSQSSKQWKWREGSRKPAKYAAILGAVIERLENGHGQFSAKVVVDAARKKTSPIHDLFEWNNKIAGERYREEQARNYIRELTFTIATPAGPRTTSVAVSFGHGDGYTSTDRVMRSAKLRKQLLAQALAEADSWRERYRFLKELSAVFDAIESVKKHR